FGIPLLIALFARGVTGRVFIGLGVASIAIAVFALSTLASMVIWGVAAHLLLRMTGRTLGGHDRTARSIYFGSGAPMVPAIPCLGTYLGGIAWVVSSVFIVRHAQRVSALRATFAVATPPVVVLAVLMIGYMVFVFRTISTGRSFAMVATTRFAFPPPGK